MISVIIPTYNNLELCQKAVTSVIKQKKCDYEIVITDDSPDNEIEDWCRKLNYSNVRYFHNQPSKGAVENWNYGMSLAQGDIIILMHHDESFANDDFLARVEKKMEKYDVVIHNKQVLFGNRVKEDRIPLFFKKVGVLLIYPILMLNFIGPCACVSFKKNISEDFDIALHWKVDTEWYFRLFRNAGAIKYFNEIEIVSHHGHEGQITNNIDVNKVAADDRLIIKNKYHSLIINMCLWLGTLLAKVK